MTALTFTPRHSLWNLDSLIPLNFVLCSEIVESVDREVHENFVVLLGRDVFSEGDSLPLFDYIMQRADEMSPEFLAMIKLWLIDECKHFEGLRRVYHAVSGVSYQQMDQEFSSRVHEIEPISEILTDEFSILVALLFDELGSTFSYRRDVREYYRHYGPEICRFAKMLVADEGIHFNNALGIIKANHAARLSEIEPLLQRISDLEKNLGRYCKTFFLDHAQEQFRFPEDFNETIIQIIVAKLGLGKMPNQVEHLWLWKPLGSSIVPLSACSLG